MQKKKLQALDCAEDSFKTENMCERVVEMISLTLKNILDTCKTDSINMRAFRKDPRTVIFVPDRYRTLKTCGKKFETKKEVKDIHISL